jgi:hypothetical protein
MDAPDSDDDVALGEAAYKYRTLRCSPEQWPALQKRAARHAARPPRLMLVPGGRLQELWASFMVAVDLR